MSASATSLGPRSLGEILDRTVQLYRGNFLLFTGISSIPIAILLVFFVPIGVLIGYFSVTGGATPQSAIGIGLLVLLMLLAIPIFIAATVFTQAGLSLAAVQTHIGQALKVHAVLKQVRPQFWRYAWLLILQGIIAGLVPAAGAGVVIGALAFLSFLAGSGAAANVALGFFAVLIIGVAAVVMIWLALCYSLGMAVCIAEKKTAWESLKRSVALSSGSRGRIFVMFLLVWALSVVVSMIGYIPSVLLVAIITAVGHGAQYGTFAVAAAQVINFLVNFCVQILIAPVYVTALVLFYYDQRVRTEGYDIEWMMEQAGLMQAGSPPQSEAPRLTSELITPPDSVKEQ